MENENDNIVSGWQTDEFAEITLDDYEKAQQRIEQLEKEKETLVIQKNKYKEKLQKGQEKAPENKAFEERLELRVDGYSADEVDFILANGGRKALENKFVKTAIETMREQRKSENAAIDESTVGGTGVGKKYNQSDLDKMSLEDLEKLISSTAQ